MKKTIIDVCCGCKMFWYSKSHPEVVYMDIRKVAEKLCDGRNVVVDPDIIGDFKDIPFPDNTFKLAVFDPPHMIQAGENSWLCKKYGRLDKDWQSQIKQGFDECIRVLEPYGILVFKWSEGQIPIKDVLDVIDYSPLFGDKRAKTMWMVFMKEVAK